MDTVSIGVSPGMQAVASGSLDVMHNTVNAVVSFIESGGSGTKISLATVATHPGVLVGKKGLKSISELKGKVIGTSSIKSGSTILLRRLLKAHGLDDKDYDLVAGQGTAQIFQGLQAGAYDAIWLVPPQSIIAANAGYSILGTFREVAPKFYFVCFAVNTNWLNSKTKVAQGFAKAWLQGVAWLYDPANRAEAEKILAEELKIAPDIAAKTYEELIVNTKGTYPLDGKVDFDVLKSVIEIMVEGEELPALSQGRPAQISSTRPCWAANDREDAIAATPGRLDRGGGRRQPSARMIPHAKRDRNDQARVAVWQSLQPAALGAALRRRRIIPTSRSRSSWRSLRAARPTSWPG